MEAHGTSRRACRSLLVGLMALGLSGCIYLAPPNIAFRSPVVAPTPSAPAHGHRHTERGSPDMIYDSRLGLYVVLGYPDHFHDGKRYYRRLDGRWQHSAELHQGWSEVRLGEVPQALLAGSPPERSPSPASPAKHDY